MGFLDLTSLCGFVDVFSGPANPISAISILALSSPSDVSYGAHARSLAFLIRKQIPGKVKKSEFVRSL